MRSVGVSSIMSHMHKKSFLFLAFTVVLFAATLVPERAKAQITGGAPFGGLVVGVLPCTCPATLGNFWVSYAPLWFGSAPAVGALVYSPLTTKLHPLYQPVFPGKWHLGTYAPGVQACWMINPAVLVTGIPCVPFPAAGIITSLGTS
jgi:hypothetical protein